MRVGVIRGRWTPCLGILAVGAAVCHPRIRPVQSTGSRPGSKPGSILPSSVVSAKSTLCVTVGAPSRVFFSGPLVFGQAQQCPASLGLQQYRFNQARVPSFSVPCPHFIFRLFLLQGSFFCCHSSPTGDPRNQPQNEPRRDAPCGDDAGWRRLRSGGHSPRRHRRKLHDLLALAKMARENAVNRDTHASLQCGCTCASAASWAG